MRVINTSLLNEEAMKHLTLNEAAWAYNGLDVCVTAEIYNTLTEQLSREPDNVRETYEMALAKQAPILEMSMRGTLIDEYVRLETLNSLEKDLKLLDARFQRIMKEVFGGPINWRSPLQLKNLFYGMLGLKEIKKRNANGIFTATVNRDALEAFQQSFYARPLARFILLMRDVHKQISFLKSELDPDHRIRCNYNIAGTNTGRLSSSMNDFGTGTNLQNVNRKLRFPFSADPGMYLVNIDLEQADGRNVGAICWETFYDTSRETITDLLQEAGRLKKGEAWEGPIGPEFAGSYLDACEGGDLHTTVCRMVWPGLGWPDDESEWKSFCDSIIAHGQDSYRQLSKKGGHGTNYYGTPRTMAKHLHLPAKLIADFQNDYFTAFPCIPAWHIHTIRTIKECSTLTTLFGRRRVFFGRPSDASTHRKAIAYAPQSMTGEQIDRALLNVWRKFPQVQLLNQVHDSILLQLPFSEAYDLIPAVLDAMKVELILKGGRKFSVPLDAAAGWNWGYFNPKKPQQNPYGLKKWTGTEEREKPNPRNRLGDFLR